jgi:hypothetical protein
MPVELRLSSSPFLKCPRVRPCECGCIHKDPLFLMPTGVLNYILRMEHPWMPGCISFRLKGRKNLFLFFPFDYLMASIVNREIVGPMSTIIPELVWI